MRPIDSPAPTSHLNGADSLRIRLRHGPFMPAPWTMQGDCLLLIRDANADGGSSMLETVRTTRLTSIVLLSNSRRHDGATIVIRNRRREALFFSQIFETAA